MGKSVFVSYSHTDGKWVRRQLVPCLKAAGVDVRIDEERMRVGQPVIAQMDTIQDGAETTLMVLTPAYLASPYCVHEMERAVARAAMIPVLRADCPALPDAIQRTVFADLRDDSSVRQWDAVMDACGADLGAAAPDWLATRDELAQLLGRRKSVNLVVTGSVDWRTLMADATASLSLAMPVVDLHHGSTAHRAGLVSSILRAWGHEVSVPDEPKDLPVLSRHIDGQRRAIALTHFERAKGRNYDIDLYGALRCHIEARELLLLIESRVEILRLISTEHPLSSLGMVTVELRGR